MQEKKCERRIWARTVARALAWSLLVVWASVTPAAWGQNTIDFVVAGEAGDYHSAPDVAKAPTGESLVVYKSLINFQADGHGIGGQLIDAEGNKIGGEFLINTYTTGGQEDPRVAGDGNNNFVVVWDCNGSGDIRGQRVNSFGQLLGSEFVVNSVTTGGPRNYPAVAAADNGNFVVAWDSSGVEGDSDQTVQARRFASDGSPIGAQFRANRERTAFSQERPGVGVHEPTGDFIIAWESTEPTSNDDIRVGRWTSDGSPVGAEIIANANTVSFQQWPRVGVGYDGRFYVSWHGETTTDFDNGISFRRFASDGSPDTAEQIINTYTTGRQHLADMDVMPDGTVTLVWNSVPNPDSSDIDGDGVMGTIFSPDGLPSQNQMNTMTAGDQIEPAVGWDARWRYVTVWEDESSDAIIGRLHDAAFVYFPNQVGQQIPQSVVGNRALGQWFDANVRSVLGTRTVTATIENLTGDADLYLRRGQRPTDTEFDCRSNQSGTATETCSVNSSIPDVWWIGVANWDVGKVDFQLTFDLVPDASLIFMDGFENGDFASWSSASP